MFNSYVSHYQRVILINLTLDYPKVAPRDGSNHLDPFGPLPSQPWCPAANRCADPCFTG